MERYLVETNSGKVRGAPDGPAVSWKGIPYAAPPVKGLRFQPARPVEPWGGVRDAAAFSPACPQVRGGSFPMDEDCLTLNIWSPAADGERRPVMFFIHGGSFCVGAGSDPELNGARLASGGGVVVVTVNYRLGALGFLDFSFLGPDFTPNCGLTDLVEALRWVSQNIGAFGGDPKNITVFGQSAGAIVASVLPDTPSAHPYVSRAIMMSGGPTLPYRKQEYWNVARKFMEFTGLSRKTLLTAPAEKIAARQKEFMSYCGLGAGTYMIEIDGEIVRDYPIPAAVRGEVARIPMLIGTTREEMSFLFIRPLADRLDVGGIMDAGVDVEEEAVRKRIADAYLRYGRRGRAIMMADLVFRMASIWFAEAYSACADTWMYRFDFETAAMKLSGLHAFHSSDLPFAFGNHRAGLARWMFLLSPVRKKINRMTEEMQRDFVAFARTGTLPWQKCRGKETPGKCYADVCRVSHMVEPDIKAEYENTNFYRRSFAGESNNLHR